MNSKVPYLDDFNEELRHIWNADAEWWDDKIGDGYEFQNELIEPATKALLDIDSDTHALDIACGASRFAHRMAEKGTHVVAFDFSEKFIKRVRQKTPPKLNIEHHVADATDRNQILAFGIDKYDMTVCAMGIMDMVDIDPLFLALHECLKPRGKFIFSIMHPCFDSA